MDVDKIKTVPADGMGFVYILSNPAFPNLYKVGLTSQNIKDRVKDLNSTGVPDRFKIEYLFEVPLKYLDDIESSSHRKLKKKKLHHNKEFFKDLSECKNTVLETIVDFTSTVPKEHVEEFKQLQQKNAQEEIVLQEEQRRLAIIQERKKEELSAVNDFIKILRTNAIERAGKPDVTVNAIGCALSLIIFYTVFILIFEPKNPDIWFIALIPILLFYIHSQNQKKSDIEYEVSKDYPNCYLEDMNKFSYKHAKYASICHDIKIEHPNYTNSLKKYIPFSDDEIDLLVKEKGYKKIDLEEINTIVKNAQ